MALTKEDLQAIRAMMQEEMEPIKEQQKVHNESILRLENNVMRELKMLNENLPDAMARREQIIEVANKVDDHDNRIFALEQKASNR